MRRSRRIATLTLGGACLLALAACGDDEGAEAKVYPSVEDCVAETKDEATCKKDFEDAQKRHAETAPNYPARGSCEEMYGQGKCVPVQKQDSHGGLTEMFMPALAGFLLGRTMGQSQPVVVDRSGYAYVGGNRWGTPPRRDERSYGGGGG
ncbi:MAG: DUF1190 domain-containing protein, partial [Rhodospirillales bacterium]|nr:DUF1190 domain-containing protein [Rhodospirillales bacterium]